MNQSSHKISAFQLAMITIAFVASVRSLPTLAEYGASCIFYYLLAAVVFLVPTALVSAELATGWPHKGGVYLWVKEALGHRWGFLAIWLQFLTNIIGLPVFLSFIAATSAYVFMPQLANNKYFMIAVILTVFWGATFVSFFGMRVSGWLNTYGAFAGVFVPALLIIILGAVWLIAGNPSRIPLTPRSFIPHYSNFHLGYLAFLAGLIYSLTGMEVSGSHAADVENAQKSYSKGIFLAAILIACVGFGALSIAVVVPQQHLSLVAGVMQAFTVFFDHLHMRWMVSVLALLMISGGICALNSSIIGPSKGLFGAAADGELPEFLSRVNKHNMPVNMFILQAILITAMTMMFLFMPNVSSSYWLLLAMVVILYLFMYILLFISVLVLRYKRPEVKRGYVVPGGKFGIWTVSLLGLISTIFAIIVGFFPPTQIKTGGVWFFELTLISGVLLLAAIGLVLPMCKPKK